MCSYCNKPGHTIEVCFKKHGIPPYLNKLSLAQTSEEKNYGLNQDQDEPLLTQNVDTIFTHDQQKSVRALFQQAPPSPQASMHQLHTTYRNLQVNFTHNIFFMIKCLILDTGATDHTCHSSSMFSHLIEIKPLII